WRCRPGSAGCRRGTAPRSAPPRSAGRARRRRRSPTSPTGRGSWHEQDLPRGLAAFQRAMRLGGVLERELELRAQLQLAVADPAEQLARALRQLLARGDVGVEAGPRQVERPLGAEQARIEGADRSARLAVERQQAARGETVQALVERGLADGVVDDLQPLAVGEALD